MVRSVSGLTTALVALLGAQIFVDLVTIVVAVSRISLTDRVLAGELVTDAELLDADEAVAGAAGLYLLVFLATGVVWLVWQHRAQDNLVRAGVRGLAFTPGWAVGWWFVPFANLWKPFQAMSELRLASAEPEGWSRSTRPAILWGWWIAWLLSGAIAWGVVGPGDPTTWEELKRSDLLDAVSSLLSIGSASLAIVIVRAIGTAQARLRSGDVPLGGSAFPAPPALPGLPPPPPG
jgi:hypothetical protein